MKTEIETSRIVDVRFANARSAVAAGIVCVLGAAAAGCTGADVYHREDQVVVCQVDREVCAVVDSSGHCAQIAANHQQLRASLCYSQALVSDVNKLCQDTFCTNDVNAPGVCHASFSSAIGVTPGMCEPAGAMAGSAVASVRVIFDGLQPGDADESGSKALTPVHEDRSIEGNTVCLDVTQIGAAHQIGLPSTDFSRTDLLLSVTLNAPECKPLFAPPAALFDLTAGVVATASGGGTSAGVNLLRGNARVGLDCFGDGDVCTFGSLADLRADLADMTVAGAQLTGLRLSLTQPATLTAIPDGHGGTFKGVAAGALRLAVNGKLNGADAVFIAGNAAPLRVDVTNPAFHLTGQLAFDNLGPGHAALPITVAVDAHGTPATAATSACASASSLARLFGFEDVQSWSSPQAALSLVTSPVTQGCGALGVRGQGYMPINGAAFSTAGLSTNSAASVDLFIPGNQPNPSWLGALQMYLTCPSGAVFNQYIGQVELTGKPVGRYSTLRFPLPSATQAALGRALDDCAFSFALNVNATGKTWSLDNLRFTP